MSRKAIYNYSFLFIIKSLTNFFFNIKLILNIFTNDFFPRNYSPPEYYCILDHFDKNSILFFFLIFF